MQTKILHNRAYKQKSSTNSGDENNSVVIHRNKSHFTFHQFRELKRHKKINKKTILIDC